MADYDQQLLLALNGSDSLFVDGIAVALTTAQTWIPLYVALFFLVIHNNENIRQVLLVVAGAALCVMFAGSVDDLLVKPFVARWRPTHDPQIAMLVDVVDGYRGGQYGFFSAHAANTFSLAIFFSFLVRNGLFTTAMIAWSLVNCWTRLYLGVHYPADIVCGIAWGSVVGASLSYVVRRIHRKMGRTQKYISTKYTSTGYLLADANIVIAVLTLTFIYVAVKACVTAL